jgi:hypothetical protein
MVPDHLPTPGLGADPRRRRRTCEDPGSMVCAGVLFRAAGAPIDRKSNSGDSGPVRLQDLAGCKPPAAPRVRADRRMR